MATKKQIELTSIIAFATAITPVLAADGAEAAAVTEHPDTVRPFHINVPEEALADLRRRIAATRWPDRETVADQSQGLQFAKIQPFVRYWGTDYDWRKVEAKPNALGRAIRSNCTKGGANENIA
jgi:hypothetical protein